MLVNSACINCTSVYSEHRLGLDRFLYITLLLLLLYNIYIVHYITITLSASHYKAIKIIQDTNWYEVKVKTKQK